MGTVPSLSLEAIAASNSVATIEGSGGMSPRPSLFNEAILTPLVTNVKSGLNAVLN